MAERQTRRSFQGTGGAVNGGYNLVVGVGLTRKIRCFNLAIPPQDNFGEKSRTKQ